MNKLTIEIEFDDTTEAILGLASVSAALVIGILRNLAGPHTLYSYLTESIGRAKVIGKWRLDVI